MNEDQVKGKVKDVAGRVERQVGEWTGDKEKQVHGAVKQVEGKVQNAWGDAKDAGKDVVETQLKQRKMCAHAAKPAKLLDFGDTA